MPDLTLAGAAAGQAVTDATTLSPFAAVSLTSSAASTPFVSVTLVLSSTANGALSHLGIGVLSADGSTYTVEGSPTDVQAALRGLVFTPVAHEVTVGSAVTTGFTLTASDAAGAVTDARTSVVATAADTLPTVTDTSATQAPTASNAEDPNGPGITSVRPFANTTITDPDAGAAETTTVRLTQNGAATDAVGLLSGTGLTKTGVGTYTLAAASPSAESAALQALRFTPNNPDTGATLAVTFSVADGVGAPVTATSSIGVGANPGGETVISNSATPTITYNDTPASNATHTYATTIDGVLSTGAVVYDQSFDLPYSDPQVQAAVAQAKATVQSAGQTVGSPTQTASNLTTLSSQTTAMQTGSSTGPSVVSGSETFGPAYVGPNTNVAGDADRGFLHVQSGQLDINLNTAITTTVSRTVTTTSTDLLTQQYLVTGTSTAMAASTTTLVSTSAAGVEGNSYSDTAGIVGGVTADGTSVLFTSGATNLSPGDTNATADLFLKNTTTGAITLVSTNATGVRPNADVTAGSVDGDGNLAAFVTAATNLNPRATDATDHTYVRNVSAGTLTLISPADYVITNAVTGAVEASTMFAGLSSPSLSGDGRYVAVHAARGNASSILLLDTVAHTGVDLNSDQYATASQSAVSRDGSTVVLSTTSPLQPAGSLPADPGGDADIYAYSRTTNSFQLVSQVEGPNTPSVKGNGASFFPTVSNDGSRVAFETQSTNLDDRDTDTTYDVYVSDLSTGRLFLVDVTADGSTKANSGAFNPSISGDGTMVAFLSQATNLVPGVTDGLDHIYIKNLLTGAVSVADTSSAGTPGNRPSDGPVFSPDSAHVAFGSEATNLVANDTNGQEDVFLTGVTAPAPPANTPPMISGVPAAETDPGGASIKPFAGATVVDTNAAPTITVQLQSVAVVNGQPQNPGTGGAFAGGGFTVAGGMATFTSTSLAAVQAAVQMVSFTPTAADARIVYTISDSTGGTSVASVDVLTTANTPPTVTGLPPIEVDAGKATFQPFTTAVVTDPDAGQTFSVQVISNYAGREEGFGGTFSGGGFTSDGVTATFTSTSIADVQAALRALQFTPTAPTAGLSIYITDGMQSYFLAASTYVDSTGPSTNTAPSLGGTVANQPDTAGVRISPFSTVTVTDPDAGQAETVTVSFAAANGALTGGGFALVSPGVYSVAAASAAAAQADLRAAVFIPAAGQSTTTALAIAVTDGQATATDSTTSVVATFTPAATGGVGGGAGAGGGTPRSAQAGLLTEFQNLERALLGGADALTVGTTINSAFATYKVVAAQLDNGQITLAQAETTLAHLVDGTTAVAVADYAFFTGFTPTAQGLNYLVHSPNNATDLNDAYYAKFTTENRYINFAVNLATGPGAGASAFQASYGSLSLAEATAKAYAAVFGTPADAAKVSALLDTLVPDGLGGQETRASYFAQYGGDGPNGQGTKAAAIGFLLSNVVHDGSGVYGAATEHYLAALAHGSAPAFGSELALTYGPNVNLVGFTPNPDPTITG